MNHSRPKNLNLFTIRFPIPAIASILHRISGVILFILLPFLLFALDYSLKQDGFIRIQSWMGNVYVQALVWLILIPYLFHLVAGVRHLLADIHIGDSLHGGRLAAKLTFIISFLLIVLAGYWLW